MAISGEVDNERDRIAMGDDGDTPASSPPMAISGEVDNAWELTAMGDDGDTPSDAQLLSGKLTDRDGRAWSHAELCLAVGDLQGHYRRMQYKLETLDRFRDRALRMIEDLMELIEIKSELIEIQSMRLSLNFSNQQEDLAAFRSQASGWINELAELIETNQNKTEEHFQDLKPIISMLKDGFRTPAFMDKLKKTLALIKVTFQEGTKGLLGENDKVIDIPNKICKPIEFRKTPEKTTTTTGLRRMNLALHQSAKGVLIESPPGIKRQRLC